MGKYAVSELYPRPTKSKSWVRRVVYIFYKHLQDILIPTGFGKSLISANLYFLMKTAGLKSLMGQVHRVPQARTGILTLD